jgi:hypothetical protein
MSERSGETMAEDAAAESGRAATDEGPPGKQERIDFLKQAIAFTEWNIRSFDTKAQISIAAFVLSMNPIWTILSAANPRAGSSLLVACLLVLFVTTVLLFGFVIWPARVTQTMLSGAWETKGLFYVGDPNQLTASLYSYRLQGLTIETELAAETLKLAAIREIKSRRFKHALVAAVIFYAGVVLAYLLLRTCTAGDRTWACGY